MTLSIPVMPFGVTDFNVFLGNTKSLIRDRKVVILLELSGNFSCRFKQCYSYECTINVSAIPIPQRWRPFAVHAAAHPGPQARESSQLRSSGVPAPQGTQQHQDRTFPLLASQVQFTFLAPQVQYTFLAPQVHYTSFLAPPVRLCKPSQYFN